jgi:hypothetical protein
MVDSKWIVRGGAVASQRPARRRSHRAPATPDPDTAQCRSRPTPVTPDAAKRRSYRMARVAPLMAIVHSTKFRLAVDRERRPSFRTGCARWTAFGVATAGIQPVMARTSTFVGQGGAGRRAERACDGAPNPISPPRRKESEGKGKIESVLYALSGLMVNVLERGKRTHSRRALRGSALGRIWLKNAVP